VSNRNSQTMAQLMRRLHTRHRAPSSTAPAVQAKEQQLRQRQKQQQHSGSPPSMSNLAAQTVVRRSMRLSVFWDFSPAYTLTPRSVSVMYEL
jgi:hypothetical protein